MRFFGLGDHEQSNKCKVCGTELPDSDRLKKHQEKAHGKKSEKCRSCGTEFQSSEELRKHKKKCR